MCMGGGALNHCITGVWLGKVADFTPSVPRARQCHISPQFFKPRVLTNVQGRIVGLCKVVHIGDPKGLNGHRPNACQQLGHHHQEPQLVGFLLGLLRGAVALICGQVLLQILLTELGLVTAAVLCKKSKNYAPSSCQCASKPGLSLSPLGKATQGQRLCWPIPHNSKVPPTWHGGVILERGVSVAPAPGVLSR